MSTVPTPTTGSHAGYRAVTSRRSGVSRAGHAIAVFVTLVLLYVINVWPGWDAVPFLTPDTSQVIGLVNASLWVSAAAETTYVITTSAWWRALGDAVTTGVGLAAAIRVWQVFPFDLSSGWDPVARVFLGIAIVGGIVGIVSAISRLVRALTQTSVAGRP